MNIQLLVGTLNSVSLDEAEARLEMLGINFDHQLQLRYRIAQHR
jgi:hypothetical protein